MSYQLCVNNVDLKNKLPLAWHVLIKLIGLSMVSVFLPAILKFEYGLTLAQIFLYEALFSIVILFFSYFSSLSFTARHGSVASMFLGVCVFVLNFVVLYYAKQYAWLIVFSPFLSGIYVAYFWVGYHTAMALQAKDNKHFGAQNSHLESIAIVAGLIGPVLGGLLADRYGSSMLYIATIVFLLVSVVPFFFHQQRHTPIQFHPSSSFVFAKKTPGLLKAILISFSAMGYVYFVGSVVRSILLFMFMGTYTKLAVVTFVSGIFLLILIKLIGNKHDETKGNNDTLFSRLMKRSFWSQSGTWLIAGVFIIGGLLSQFLFVLIDTLHKVTYRVNELSLMTYFYETIGEEKNITHVLHLIFIREVAIHLSKIVFCCFLALMTYLFQGYEYWTLIFSLFLVFLVAPFGSYLLTRKQQYASEHTLSKKAIVS